MVLKRPYLDPLRGRVPWLVYLSIACKTDVELASGGSWMFLGSGATSSGCGARSSEFRT